MEEPVLTNPPIDPQTPPAEPPVNNDPPVTSSSDNDLIKNPAVRALVEHARKQEKDKLYKSIEAEQEKAKALVLKLQEVEGQLKERDGKHMAEVKDLETKVEGLQQQIGTLLDTIEQEKSTREREKAEAEAKARTAELKAYKERSIREAGDELVIELVGGDSEEAIDKSVELAKQKYQEIADKVGKTKETPAQRVANNSTRATAPSNHQTPTFTKEQINAMTREEYAKNRPLILEMARKGLLD